MRLYTTSLFFPLALLVFGVCLPVAAAPEEIFNTFEWSNLPDLPPARGKAKQVGLAGPFAGTHQGALLVAGGANFPDLPPWQGGTKIWWDDVYVLEKDPHGKPSGAWLTSAKLELPLPTAYGVSISTDKGLLCIGGRDAKRCHADVFRLQWLRDEKEMKVQQLPPLPRPLANMAGAKVGDVVYLAGGQETVKGNATQNFWAIDLSKPDDELKWEELTPCPGPPRILPVAAAQKDGRNDCFFLFSGRNPIPDQPTELLTDSYKYDPKEKTWTRLADVSVGSDQPLCVMAGIGTSVGVSHVFVFGGADGLRFLEVEALNAQIEVLKKEAADNNGTAPDELAELQAEHRRFHEEHTGFSSDVLAYHTITNTWTKMGEAKKPFPVTTGAVEWDLSLDGDKEQAYLVIPTGESSPGIRSTEVLLAKPAERNGFSILDYSAVALYLAVLIFIGIHLAKKEKSPEDFFKAGGRIPWWAAGLSIFGTQLSAITFMALPAKAYATDWTYLFGNLPIVLIAPLIVFCCLPFYRKLDVTTAYEYLEQRFDGSVRLVASSFFILLQLARIGVVLLLPSLALQVVTGVDVNTCILVMGVLCIIYVTMGGIEAVIWTDVIQVVVLIGGAIFVVFSIAGETAGGFQGILDQADAADKLRCVDLRWNLSEPTFWTLMLGGLAASFISYGSDQTVVQRYLTTKDEKASARGIWTNAALTIPATMLFFLVGAALYVFYANHPASLDPHLTTNDAILPFYVVDQMPDGIAGLVIAGLFAAAMSSLDSSMNSVAAAVTTDFHGRSRPKASAVDKLRVARIATVAVGVAGTILALVLAGSDIKSLWDQFVDFLGLFGGGLGGLFLLALFADKAHAKGALLGLLASAVVVFSLKTWAPVHSWFYAFAGLAACFLVGYAASYLLPRKESFSTAGLTWKSRNEEITPGRIKTSRKK
jgi:solute:Na+ symporter, SSS family